MQNLAFLNTLNPQQLEAVTATDGSSLVLAGAGSGKTRVLTTRIAWLLHTDQAKPNQILAVTFTNKAAREMVTRISAMIPFAIDRAWIGTFHGLCNRMLRIHATEAGLMPSFQIIDSADQLSIIRQLTKDAKLPDDRFRPSFVANFINQQKENGVRARYAATDYPWAKELLSLYAAYEALCQKDHIVDFAELLLRSYELLLQNDALRAHYQERFRHILVDEFQDTNTLQYQWLRLLSGTNNTVFAVGDDDQSIYSFRGANATHMQRFERDFQIKHIIRLEQNYRSFGHILDAANALITYNHNRLGKNLWTDAGKGDRIQGFEAKTDLSEARWVVERVERRLKNGIPANEIAILYRSNAQSRVLEHALFSAGVAYRVYGGLRFFERQEIKHAMAYLRLIANTNDDSSFQRIINFPPRGIGTRSIDKLRENAQLTGSSLFEAAKHTLSGRSAATAAQFTQFIEQKAATARDMPLDTLLSDIIHQSGLIQYYQTEKDGADRIDNLKELISAAALFSQDPATEITESMSLLDAFLDHASLEAGDTREPTGAAVQLMTIHAAKGLEFDTVFLTGVEEGLLPHDNSLSAQQSLEEERRLMYVAITRARVQLNFSLSRMRMLHGQQRFFLRSRFLDEIPDSCMTWENESFNGAISPMVQPAKTQIRPTQGSEWRIGQQVRHTKFGEGTILAIEGCKEDQRLQIRFRGQGVKWLALAYASTKLSPA